MLPFHPARMLPAAVLTILFAPALPSQQAPLPDSTRLVYRDLLYQARDSVASVAAAVWGFNRDLNAAGTETVLARASRLVSSCRAAERTLTGVGAAAGRTVPGAAFQREVAVVLDTLRVLCVARFTPGAGHAADSIRVWGPHHGAAIERAIHRYETAARRFASAAGVRLEPRVPTDVQ